MIDLGVLGILFVRSINAIGNMPKYFASLGDEHSALWSVKNLTNESNQNKEQYNSTKYLQFNLAIFFVHD